MTSFVGGAAPARAQELTEAQHAHMAAMLPKLLAKLEQHAAVHAIVLGDSVSNYFLPGGAEDSEVFIKAFQNEFLRRLADRFFYTGGVRDIKPRKGNPDNLLPVLPQSVQCQHRLHLLCPKQPLNQAADIPLPVIFQGKSSSSLSV